MINNELKDFLQQFVIGYMDDILIYSLDITSHVQHVQLVLQRLLKHKLYIKGGKCEIHKDTIALLGYNINKLEVSMDQKKVSAV